MIYVDVGGRYQVCYRVVVCSVYAPRSRAMRELTLYNASANVEILCNSGHESYDTLRYPVLLYSVRFNSRVFCATLGCSVLF